MTKNVAIIGANGQIARLVENDILNNDKDVDGKVAVTTDKNGLVSIVGLDAGSYTITEVKAPSGYALLGTPVTVEITDQGGNTPNGTAQIEVSGAGTAETSIENNNGTIDLMVRIANTKGINLPETGSKAAMYFLVAGAALLMVGGLFFGVASRRKKTDE